MVSATKETANPGGDKGGGRSVVLLLATGRWISTARLAIALAELGCAVELVAPANHPASLTSDVQAIYRYDPLFPLRSLRRALAASQPTTLLAVDELMVQHLEELWQSTESPEASEAPRNRALRALIQRSLGDHRTLAIGRSRMELLQMAQDAGIATPRTVEVDRPAVLDAAMQQFGLPMVLKANAASGGRGVRVIADPSEAPGIWNALQQPPRMARALMRGVVWKEWTHLRRSAKKETREITAQEFISGPERTGMVACHNGEVLASECLEVVRNWEARGPSSVLRVIHNEVMDTAMRRIVRELGISGFCGFDFIVDEKTDRTLLIEMNLRPTQMVHLPLGAGRDLVAAYVREVLGVRGVHDRAAATTGDLIALFPQELQRDTASEFLAQAFHDVPWSAPRLIDYSLKGLPQDLLSSATETCRDALGLQQASTLASAEK